MSNRHEFHFPKARSELLLLLEQDQKQIRSFPGINKSMASDDEKLRHTLGARHDCHARARRMLQILYGIKEPTAENIGLDGSEAVAVLALHSYLAVMKRVLAIFERCFRKEPSSVFYQLIPSLKDRIMIVEQKKQLYGTNWMQDKQGKPFLVPVKDFPRMNQRRALYGLKPARRPVNLAYGATRYPLGKGLANESDQKKMTQEEYDEYSRYIIRPLGFTAGDEK